MSLQRSIYCGKLHRRADGLPINHACRVLDPAYLEAERREDYGRAAAVLDETPLVLHKGIRVAPEAEGPASSFD